MDHGPDEEEEAIIAKVIEACLTGGVYRPTPVTQTPDIVITRWGVYELANGNRHIVGYNVTEHEGRVSSRLVSWEPATRIATTRSGRRYELTRTPGVDVDANYVWSRWRGIYGIVEGTYRDVSDEYEVKEKEES